MLITNFGSIPSQGGLMLPDWSYGKKITIPANSIDADLPDFPCTVILNSTNFDFSKAKSDGSDIRFTDKLFNHYKFEKIEYSNINQFAKFTVLIPTVSDLTDTKFYVWAGNSNAYNTSIEAWQDQTGKALTYNGNVKMAYNSTYGRRVGSFDGGGDYFSIAHATDFEWGSSNFTIERKVVFSSVSTSQTLYGKSVDASNYLNFYYSQMNNRIVFDGHVGGVSIGNFYCSFTPTTSTVYDIAFVRNGSACLIFINGVSQTVTQVTAFSSNVKVTNGFYIGGYNASTHYFNGYDLGIKLSKSAKRTANYTIDAVYTIDGTDVVFCTNFDTIYNQDYAMVQHMGDSLVDATGNGNNGTATGTTVVSTELGKARLFDGNDSISIANDSVATQWTLSSLLYHESLFSAYEDIFYGDGGTEAYPLILENGKPKLYDTGLTSPTVLQSGWNVLSSKSDGANSKLFRNGVVDNSVATSKTSKITHIGSKANASEYLNGKLLEARKSNTARSDAYIKAESKALKNELVTITNI